MKRNREAHDKIMKAANLGPTDAEIRKMMCGYAAKRAEMYKFKRFHLSTSIEMDLMLDRKMRAYQANSSGSSNYMDSIHRSSSTSAIEENNRTYREDATDAHPESSPGAKGSPGRKWKVNKKNVKNETWSDRMSIIAAPFGSELYLSNESVGTILGAPRFYFNDFKTSTLASLPDGTTRFPYSDMAHVAAKRIQRLFLKFIFLKYYCAALIQRHYRLYVIRRDYKHVLTELKVAVSRIQRFYRRRAARYKFRKAIYLLKMKSAIKIQSLARQSMVRKRIIPALREQQRFRLYTKLYFWIKRCIRRKKKHRGILRRKNLHASRIQRIIRGVLCRMDLRIIRSAQIMIAWAFRRYWRKKFRRYAHRFVGALRRFVLRRKIHRMQSLIRGFLGRRRAERFRLKLLSANVMRTTQEQLVLSKDIARFTAEVSDWSGDNDAVNMANQMRQLDLLTRQILARKLTTSRAVKKSVTQSPSKQDGHLAQTQDVANEDNSPPKLSRTQLYVYAILTAFSNRPDGLIDSVALQSVAEYLTPIKAPQLRTTSASRQQVPNNNELTDLQLARAIIQAELARQQSHLDAKHEQVEACRVRFATKLHIGVDHLDSHAHSLDVYNPVRAHSPDLIKQSGRSSRNNDEATDANEQMALASVKLPKFLLDANRVLTAMSARMLPVMNNLATNVSTPVKRLSNSVLRRLKLQPLFDEHTSKKSPRRGSIRDLLDPDYDGEQVVSNDEGLSFSNSMKLRTDAVKRRGGTQYNNRTTAVGRKIDERLNTQLHPSVQSLPPLQPGLTTGLEWEHQESARSLSSHGDGHANVQALPVPLPMHSGHSKRKSHHQQKSGAGGKTSEINTDRLWADILKQRQYPVTDLVLNDVFAPVTHSSLLTCLIRGKLPVDILLHAVIIRRWTKSLYATCISKTVVEREQALARGQCLPHRVCKGCLEPLFTEAAFAAHCGTSIYRLQMKRTVVGGVTKRQRNIHDRGQSQFHCVYGNAINWVNPQILKGAIRYLQLSCDARLLITHPALEAFKQSTSLPLDMGLTPGAAPAAFIPVPAATHDNVSSSPSHASSAKATSKDKKDTKEHGASSEAKKSKSKDKDADSPSKSKTKDFDKKDSKKPGQGKEKDSRPSSPESKDSKHSKRKDKDSEPAMSGSPSNKSASPSTKEKEKNSKSSNDKADDVHTAAVEAAGEEHGAVDLQAKLSQRVAGVSVETTTILEKAISFVDESLSDYLVSPVPPVVNGPDDDDEEEEDDEDEAKNQKSPETAGASSKSKSKKGSKDSKSDDKDKEKDKSHGKDKDKDKSAATNKGNDKASKSTPAKPGKDGKDKDSSKPSSADKKKKGDGKEAKSDSKQSSPSKSDNGKAAKAKKK
jgi:hypothetical protein